MLGRIARRCVPSQYPPSNNPKARRLFRGSHAWRVALPDQSRAFSAAHWLRANSWGLPRALMMQDSLALQQTHGLKPSSSKVESGHQKPSLHHQHNDKLAVAYLRTANDQGACFAQSGFGFQQQLLLLKKF